MKKGEQGVTLVVLTITIIVLIILSGIAIVNAFGDGGILSKSDSTKKESNISTEIEAIENAFMMCASDELGNGDEPEVSANELKTRLEKDGANVTSVTKENDNFIIVMESGITYTFDKEGELVEYTSKNNS